MFWINSLAVGKRFRRGNMPRPAGKTPSLFVYSICKRTKVISYAFLYNFALFHLERLRV